MKTKKPKLPHIVVHQMKGRSGKEVPNQLVIYADNGRLFQSYRTVIAFIDNNGKVYLDLEKWDYSTTTGKYRNIFLNEDKRTTEGKIKSGEYTLVNLN